MRRAREQKGQEKEKIFEEQRAKEIALRSRMA